MKLSLRQMTLNALFAAVYIVITIFLPSYGALQLRLSEMFAHLPLFNKKYSVGLILGVAVANMWSEFGIIDVIFGTLHTVISLWIVSLIVKETQTMTQKMVINSIVFAATSFILALMVGFLTNQMAIFWLLYIQFAASIAIVMLGTIPVMLLIDRQVDFKKVMERN